MFDILKNANSLRQPAIQKKQIESAVREVLINLNDAILQAHENGHGNLEARLPMQFNIDGMNFAKMQQCVWCSVIEELECNNYKVAIEPLEHECIIYIQWQSDDDKIESKRQLKVLAQHTIKK